MKNLVKLKNTTQKIIIIMDLAKCNINAIEKCHTQCENIERRTTSHRFFFIK